MTHELVGVIVDPSITRDTAHDAVEKILRPFREEYDEHNDELRGWWDYWLVGGRWAGVWLEGYDPDADPANVNPQPCFICGGTGQRADTGGMTRQEYIDWCGGCNGCGGKGHAVKWPSDWRPIAEDVLPVAVLIDSPGLRVPHRLVLPDGGVTSRDEWSGDWSWDPDPKWDAHVRELLMPYREAAIVAVDVHV